MILNVLIEHFNDEYEMLKYLALGDLESFNEFAQLSPEFTNHLIGYGIIEYRNDNYSFRVDSIKNYLIEKEKYKKLNLTQEDILKEISERRNTLEPKLRKLVKNQLQIFFGKSNAKEKFLKYIPEKRKKHMDKLSYEDLFDPNSNKIYFNDLKTVILKNWDVFKNIFDNDILNLELNMDCINRNRIDAHAKKMDHDELQYYRVCIGKLEKQLAELEI